MSAENTNTTAGLVTAEPNNSSDLLAEVRNQSNPTKGKVGRPPVARRRRQVVNDLRHGRADQIDRGWLLEQLLSVYSARDCRAPDRLRALELMAKVSGYGNRTEEPEDERKAIAELMKDLA